jgi:hypothetical protein
MARTAINHGWQLPSYLCSLKCVIFKAKHWGQCNKSTLYTKVGDFPEQVCDSVCQERFCSLFVTHPDGIQNVCIESALLSVSFC